MFAVVNDSSAPAFVICSRVIFCSHPPKADLTQLGGLCQRGIWGVHPCPEISGGQIMASEN